MKILAAQRLNNLRADTNVVDADTVCLDLENYIKSLFPKSFVIVGIKKNLRGHDLYINFTLGNKQDYPNNISHNDVARNVFGIYDVVSEDAKGLLKDATYKVKEGLTYTVPSTRPHMVYDTVKVSRAFSAKGLPAFIKRMKSDFKKLADSMKSNISEVSEVMRKDMSSYIR